MTIYLDSGDRSAANALGTWLLAESGGTSREFRVQSGFFGLSGLAPLLPDLKRLSLDGLPVRMLIGSNDASTTSADVRGLVDTLSLPRPNVALGIVNYRGAFFHPKTFHFRRKDGSQAAYVGSANLTGPGVSSLHVEAGLVVDTAKGDSDDVLDAIAAAVDDWFVHARDGMEHVKSFEDVDRLQADGILAKEPPPRSSAGSGTGNGSTRPTLKPLIGFPTATQENQTAEVQSEVESANGALQLPAATAVPLSPYPPYVLFAPGQVVPTSGIQALSGATLPGGSLGLVVRLNRDSARHFEGRSGTANISIPVAVVSTIRFGLFKAKYDRPRAEFTLRVRYVSDGGSFEATTSQTNVMAYGFAEGEVGHGDVRMLVPVQPSREIAAFAASMKASVPAEGSLAILQWPTISDPTMKLTTFDIGSSVYAPYRGLFDTAAKSNQLVGQGACWLPSALTLPWS